MVPHSQIKVLVVEDSNVVQMLLVQLLSADPQIKVIGVVCNGREALAFLAQTTPDVILMDVEMPEMGGFEATRLIMESRPVPIVICSGSSNPRETITAFRLMEAGAVAAVDKPLGREHKDFDAMAAHLLQTVKLMSEVKVVRRWPRAHTSVASVPPVPSSTRTNGRIELVGIGASTGGPPVLQTILTALPKDFAAPILVVQHISPGFVEGLAEWLNQTVGLTVQIAAYGTQPMPGHVYLAPDDFHMSVQAGGRIVLTKEPPDHSLRPSVGRLFASLVDVYGRTAVGVLLTGMGKDGARELRQMKDRGAVTIVQDRETSVVHGMPGEAIALGAADYVLPADRIAAALTALVLRQPLPEGARS